MDDFIDSFLQAPSWPDVNTSGKSFGGEEKTPPLCMIPTSMENIAADDLNLYVHDESSSIFIGSDLRYGNGIDRSLFSRDKLSLHEIRDHTSHGSEHRNSIHDGNFSLQGMIQSDSTIASFGHDFNTPCSSVTVRHNTLTKSSSIESNGSEPSAFQPSLGDSNSITSVPAMWPRSYSDVTLVGEGKLQGFGFQGVEGDTDIMRQTTLGNGKYTNLNDFPATSLHDHSELHNPHLQNFSVGQQKLTNGLFQRHQQEQNELRNIHMPFFVAGSQMTPSKAPVNQYHQQFPKPTEGNSIKHQINNSYGNQSQTIPANGSACNGAAKPRVRARRGQATDPHSIAERLRREKISERMKSLLELVPNSNKADKASMLDEIIDYVKFLQLQVKVLSMSRLGAAGAVAPLITDVQAEASGSFFLPSLGHRASDPLDSQENSAFEQEVVKLMESSITTAMQYLQTKGLCLMPIALASAISHQEGSTAAIPHERRISREDGPNDCNGALIKHEAVQNSSETSGI